MWYCVPKFWYLSCHFPLVRWQWHFLKKIRQVLRISAAIFLAHPVRFPFSGHVYNLPLLCSLTSGNGTALIMLHFPRGWRFSSGCHKNYNKLDTEKRDRKKLTLMQAEFIYFFSEKKVCRRNAATQDRWQLCSPCDYYDEILILFW